MDQWYVARGKVIRGPYTRAQLQRAASNGSLQVTDLLRQGAEQNWIAAGKISGLFPAPAGAVPAAVPVPPPLPTPSPAPGIGGSAVPPAPASAAPGGLRLWWLWAATGVISLGILAIGSIVILGKKSDRLKTNEPVVKNDKQTPKTVSPKVEQASKAGTPKAKMASKAGTPKAKMASKAGTPKAKMASQAGTPKAKMASKAGTPKAKGALTVVSPDVELPPVGPINVRPDDLVSPEFKAARASYVAAAKKARVDLGDKYGGTRAEIETSNLDPKEKAKSLERLQTEHRGFMKTDESRDGPIYTHPAMIKAVTEYLQTLEAATRELGGVAEKELAANQKAGVTDPVRLQPLFAALLASQNAALLGIWEGKSPGSATTRIWLIDVDENTGGWRIGGLEQQEGSQPRAAYRAERIEFKDGALAFVANPLDVKTASVRSGGNPTTLRLKNGKLQCETRGKPKPTQLELVRTDREDSRHFLERLEIKAAGGRPASGSHAPNPANANEVWWGVARLSSFNYYRSSSWDPLAHEALYLPYRSTHLTMTPGAYGGLTNMLTGRSPGASVNNKRVQDLLGQYEVLAVTPYPYLQRAIEQSEAICRNRLRLGLADEQFGNTAASSIRVFQQSVFLPAIQYSFLRDGDESRLRQSLEREHPGYRVIVNDAPLSAASREKLSELLKGAGGFMEDTKKRAVVSGLLGYADMAQVDRSAQIWQTWLLPLARRCGGPAAAKPLVSVGAAWGPTKSKSDYQRLHLYELQNVSGQSLTHVVVELIAENEWGEKSAQYYYFDQLKGREFMRLQPHMRWERRRLDFTNTVKVRWSLWADEASEVGREVKLTSPRPNPDAAGWRKDFVGYDRQSQSKGEAMGVMMQGTIALPSMPERQRRLLRKAAAPQSTYVFRLPGESGRTLILRFLRFNQDRDTFEAEIFEPGTGNPFDSQALVWTGKLNARPENGISFGKKDGFEMSWAFALVRDDQLEIACPAANKPGATFPAHEIPLFAVKGP
jgi:uncharacterized protein DUF4339